MKFIALVLIILGVIGLLLSMMMFGDIGVAAAIASLTALLSGFGFISANKKLNKFEDFK
ncbi:hypothetical protein MRBLBA21_003733 [Peribacillus frigoritolerans]|uniref:hypothetical protein n=1 Tax=Peribacillus frigoritolerans TaxID=450367 RepID=UPI0030D4518C